MVHSNGFPHQQKEVSNNVQQLPNNGHHLKSSTAQQIAAASPSKGITGGGQRIKGEGRGNIGHFIIRVYSWEKGGLPNEGVGE